MATEKKKVEYPRDEDGTLNCDNMEGNERAMCLLKKAKEITIVDTKRAMGQPPKKKEAPKTISTSEPEPEQEQPEGEGEGEQEGGEDEQGEGQGEEEQSQG